MSIIVQTRFGDVATAKSNALSAPVLGSCSPYLQVKLVLLGADHVRPTCHRW